MPKVIRLPNKNPVPEVQVVPDFGVTHALGNLVSLKNWKKRREPKVKLPPHVPAKRVAERMAEQLVFPASRARPPSPLPVLKERCQNVVGFFNSYLLDVYMWRVILNLTPHRTTCAVEAPWIVVDYRRT